MHLFPKASIAKPASHHRPVVWRRQAAEKDFLCARRAPPVMHVSTNPTWQVQEGRERKRRRRVEDEYNGDCRIGRQATAGDKTAFRRNTAAASGTQHQEKKIKKKRSKEKKSRTVRQRKRMPLCMRAQEEVHTGSQACFCPGAHRWIQTYTDAHALTWNAWKDGRVEEGQGEKRKGWTGWTRVLLWPAYAHAAAGALMAMLYFQEHVFYRPGTMGLWGLSTKSSDVP